MAADCPRIQIVGLSGPSSSGKTTLARLLRSIFNISLDKSAEEKSMNLFILHEDDFYKTDTLLPRKTFTSSEFGSRELEDWDCVESLDLDLLEFTLNHVKEHGTLPSDSFSKEDQNEVGESGVDDKTVKELQDQVRNWFSDLTRSAENKQDMRPWTICILDGFLLYPRPPLSTTAEQESTSSSESSTEQLHLRLTKILSHLLSLRLFIPSSRSLTIARRARRTGYVTLEGFWADPPGYVEDVVWPNYSADHAWMFNDANQPGKIDFSLNDPKTQQNIDEGRVNWTVATSSGISKSPSSTDTPMTDVLRWAVEIVKEMVEKKVLTQQ